jgi:hypothetical protein
MNIKMCENEIEWKNVSPNIEYKFDKNCNKK